MKKGIFSLLALTLVGCGALPLQPSPSAAEAVTQACAAVNDASPPVPDDEEGSDPDDVGHDLGQHTGNHGGHSGDHGANDAASLLLRLGSSSVRVRDEAAIRILRHAPDFGEAVLERAMTVAGDEADWRADPALVRILRDQFPSSTRHFSTALRANAALALGEIAQSRRGRWNGGERGHADEEAEDEGHGNPSAGIAVPEYIFRATENAVCPPADPTLRQAATRALGEFRDDRAHGLLVAIAASPGTSDDVQDRLLVLSAQRALTMIEPTNAVSADAITRAQRALGAMKQALAGAQP